MKTATKAAKPEPTDSIQRPQRHSVRGPSDEANCMGHTKPTTPHTIQKIKYITMNHTPSPAIVAIAKVINCLIKLPYVSIAALVKGSSKYGSSAMLFRSSRT